MPIEELSRRSGVTVRNLRELQTRGLLDPPLLEGRRGLYTERHVARVGLVRNLQDRGYSIASIKDLLQKWRGELGSLGVMGVEDGVATPGAGPARRLTEDEVLALLPELRSDEALLAEARAVELVATGEDGELFAPHAELLETARALADVGIPLDVQLADLHVLRREIEVMTARFRGRFQEHVVTKLQREGFPAERVSELATRLASLRPAVVRGVGILLSVALERRGPIGPAGAPSPAARSEPEAEPPQKSPRAPARPKTLPRGRRTR
jgi:DNA-binding transcriptional MerR regulator